MTNYRVELILADGSKEEMYGVYSEKVVGDIVLNMKRTPEKRLYKFGVNWANVRKVNVVKL